ncbi:MAG: helix-turn-helix domain-containing protein [Thermoleophilia bacterium]
MMVAGRTHDQEAELERVYTVNQVAEMLQTAPLTIRRYLKAGKIRGFKVGKDWRITESDLQAFIDAGRPTEHSGSGAE